MVHDGVKFTRKDERNCFQNIISSSIYFKSITPTAITDTRHSIDRLIQTLSDLSTHEKKSMPRNEDKCKPLNVTETKPKFKSVREKTVTTHAMKKPEFLSKLNATSHREGVKTSTQKTKKMVATHEMQKSVPLHKVDTTYPREGEGVTTSTPKTYTIDVMNSIVPKSNSVSKNDDARLHVSKSFTGDNVIAHRKGVASSTAKNNTDDKKKLIGEKNDSLSKDDVASYCNYMAKMRTSGTVTEENTKIVAVHITDPLISKDIKQIHSKLPEDTFFTLFPDGYAIGSATETRKKKGAKTCFTIIFQYSELKPVECSLDAFCKYLAEGTLHQDKERKQRLDELEEYLSQDPTCDNKLYTIVDKSELMDDGVSLASNDDEGYEQLFGVDDDDMKSVNSSEPESILLLSDEDGKRLQKKT